MMKLSENVVMLGNRHFNYFIAGEKEAAIVECGVTGSVVSLKTQWNKLKRKPDVRYLIIMHAHFDHVCGVPTLKELFPDAVVLASEKAKEALCKPKIINDFFDQDAKVSEVLVGEGIIEEKPESPRINSISVDRTIGDGDIITLDNGLELEVADSPGHSPCGISCYLRQDQVMFLSDAGGFQISDKEIFPIFFQSFEMYLQTIRNLMRFPTRVLGVPHESIWTNDDVECFYQRSLNSAQAVFNDIREMLNSGMDEDIVKRELFSRYYRGDLRIYTPKNINTCVELLIRRVKESL